MKILLYLILGVAIIIAGGWAYGQEEDAKTVGIRSALGRLKDLQSRMDATRSDVEVAQVTAQAEAIWTEISAERDAATGVLFEELDKEKANSYFLIIGARWLMTLTDGQALTAAARALANVDINSTRSMPQFFQLCHDLAKSPDPTLLPALDRLLANKDRVVSLPQYYLTLSPADILMYSYQVYGRSSARHLMELLEKSTDPVVQYNAMSLLAEFKYDPALGMIRKIVANDKIVKALRYNAVVCLGLMGDPKDIELLKKLLKDKDPEMRFNALFGLFEMRRSAAVPFVIGLLSDSEEKVRSEAIACLLNCPTAQGIEALIAALPKEKSEANRKQISDNLSGLSQGGGSNPVEFLSLKPVEREKVISRAIESRESAYALRPGVERMTHDDLVSMTREWIAGHRLTSGPAQPTDMVGLVLDAATVQDLDLLFEVRSSLLWRISGDVRKELGIIDEVIRRIHRRQFK
ncbi:MAG: HEAT repeat domain-containing protein [Candidatus Brocadiia bacterium]